MNGFSNNAGTYGSQCSCDCNCNCQCVGDNFWNGMIDEAHCALKHGYDYSGVCSRYTPQ